VVLRECLVEIPHIVEILAEGVTQNDLLRNRQPARSQGFDLPQPIRVIRRHLAMRGNARDRHDQFGVDVERPPKETHCSLESAAIGLEFAEERKGLGEIRIGLESRTAGDQRLCGSSLLAEDEGLAKMS